MKSKANESKSVKHCPECGHKKSTVIDSREGPDRLRRRRECQKCHYRWSTLEGPVGEDSTETDKAIARALIALSRASDAVDAAKRVLEALRPPRPGIERGYGTPGTWAPGPYAGATRTDDRGNLWAFSPEGRWIIVSVPAILSCEVSGTTADGGFDADATRACR